MTSLFDPLDIGTTALANRVLMAPLTRMRATPGVDVPNDLIVEYYRQRAGAGLIVSEGTQISPIGKGYMDTPGIYSPEQVEGWRKVTDAVHAEGGRIAAQIWHVGRVSHESFHDGALPVSASALPYRNRATIKGEDGRPLRADCPTPRALSLDEIAETVEDYRRATANAREAGFDLVELHGAHGYLLHQFLGEQSNHRTDEYGGSQVNRARFPLEAVDAAIDAWDAAHVGIRLSPQGSFNGLDDDDLPMALYLAAELSRRNVAFLHLSEPDWAGGPVIDDDFRKELRAAFNGVIVGAGNYTPEKAERLLAAGLIDAAAFGRPFIANPDLPERFRIGAELNDPNGATFYGGGAEGYTDYPALAAG
ncbi:MULTISPECIES: N-ethylmaleimide reductase [unclassified Nocardioides]|uniref:N-ethylmaleimide reductase n=1 Tax=unclassified Nocardioides TaxID=2615069 RepID=UPI0006FF77EA|nr:MULTISPECIES: N-ethylmaleimide reductase [unclassified Nocardioides]KRA30863.1 alkene reductase [Nocardioides sp. Root614]KRA87483.1 alkene reductase [Nocardioides sp. Root682]